MTIRNNRAVTTSNRVLGTEKIWVLMVVRLSFSLSVSTATATLREEREGEVDGKRDGVN